MKTVNLSAKRTTVRGTLWFPVNEIKVPLFAVKQIWGGAAYITVT